MAVVDREGAKMAATDGWLKGTGGEGGDPCVEGSSVFREKGASRDFCLLRSERDAGWL